MTLSPAGTLTPDALGDALASVREGRPLVHCLTNIVVANYTANVLLAAGASPAMVDNPAEAEEFATVAGGVLVNLGTPYTDTSEAMRAAVRGAERSGTPWVLDPVAAGALVWRTDIAHELVGQHAPAVIRGNASEVMALAGGGTGGRGVESSDPVEASHEGAKDLAQRVGTVVAVSGAVDHVTDGTRVLHLANGHPWLTQVTGAGCALGALMAAFAAVVDDALVAASAATATFTVAADIAAEQAKGPGTFAVALLDSLDALSPDQLSDRVRLR
jgi:hydroxyethylthiazole kinase